MPGKVRVKIIAGRNLPVMDRGSDTTDAYVEIKLANTTYKTDVYRKSLNPQWNSDFYRFELDDAELQDEPLQIRLMDYDTYSANDAIGKVNICLSPLLLPSFDMTGQVIRSGKGAVMSGWIPVFDTCKGIRGEVNVIVKVDLFSDVNKFRQSSCGVQFFHSSIIPYGYTAQTIHGFVEELVVNDDPEYQWIDKIRTPRASNEARQVVFLKLSGQVQRKIGLKAIDLGANAVIGYVQCFDLEGDVGVVARGTGTAVTLVKINESISQPIVDSALMEEQLKYLEFLNLSDVTNPDTFSKFDAQNYPSHTGDYVYKILGINHSDLSSKATSIVVNKKTKRQEKQSDTHDIIPEEPTENLENLKMLLAQEDNRGENLKGCLGEGIRKIGKSSKNMLRKRRNPFKRTDARDADTDEMSQGESVTDITRAPSTSSLRTSITDIRGILKKSIGGKPKYQRSSSDGVGMTALLVSSMMAAPSLDCISEAHDSPKSSHGKTDQHKSESLSNLPTSKGYKAENNLFLKPNLKQTPDVKTSDSNLSSNLSISSCTASSSSGNEEDDLSEDQTTQNEIVLVDADTVSMVVKSVLAQEESQLESNDWIEPQTSSSASSMEEPKNVLVRQTSTESNRKDSGSGSMLRTGGTRVTKNKRGNVSSCELVEVEANVTDMGFLNIPNPDQDADNWIQPGSTTDEPECVDTRRGSLFQELKENISEKIHSIQEHMHLTHHQPDEIRNKHGLISTAMDTILMEQATIMGAKPSLNPVNAIRLEDDKRRSSIDSLKKRITSLYRRSNESENKSELKHESGLIGTAMKTMLMEAANITEEMVVHPMNSPPQADVAPFASLNNSKRPSINECSDQLNSYGSAIEFGDITEQLIQPFISLTDLKNAVRNQSNKPPFEVHSQISQLSHPASTTKNSPCCPPSVVDNKQDCASCDSNTTNKASLLVPAPFPVDRSVAEFVGSPNKTVGHIRAESTGGKMAQSPSKGMVAGSQSAMVASTSREPIFRRSSDSDLSVTPKVRGRKRNSLSTTNERPERVDITLKTPFNHDNLDMLEYPFLTMSKYPAGFILHLGATVCSRAVKLLERVPNPDEPETRDSWWKELRMEVRSHARALNCNVILGYSEVTTISDDVCVLSVTGTAAVINPKYSFDTPSLTTTKTHISSVCSVPKDAIQLCAERSDIDKETRKTGLSKEIAHPLPIKDKISSIPTTITDLEQETEPVSTKIAKETGCTLCHIPYRKSSTFDIHSKKCSLCKIGDVPDILLITIELPDSLQITGRGCFVQAQVCRTKKDLKSESNAKEISDAIPFLEYEIHRLLVNKIKSKGMNALFGLKATIAIGERVIALIATGTAVFLPSLPAPSPPRIVAGNSWSNSDKIRDLQKSIQETFDRNREIYQLKSSEELELESKNATSDDMYLKDIEPNEIDLTNGNKDACVLEVDDIEDLEIFALLMEPSPPDGFHVVNTQTVPGLHDLEVIRNLQMFVQVYRAKLGLNQQASNFPKHFQRLVHTIYFKIRSMIPCAICDFRFRLDFPESEEIQILVTGMALGLGEPSKLTKYKRKVAAHPQTKESKRLADDELIFNLEEEELTEQLTQSLTFPSSSKMLQQTGSLKLKKSPNRSRFNSVRLAKHVPLRERFGVDLTPLCHIAGGKIDKYLGNLNFFFIRESTSVKENGGISGFVHSFITEVLAIVRANVTALGGNAMVSFYMTDMILVDNPHKNQGQCLISVGGDVVFVSYFSDDCATVCSRAVKLLERVPNPDEPETRDSWWKELRMEVRSHARALNCNVILGYSEVTTISDDVCVLSVTGTAAVINPKYSFDTPSLTTTKTHISSVCSVPKDAIQLCAERSDIDKETRKTGLSKEIAHPLPIKDKISSIPTTITDLEHETEPVSTKIAKETGCTLCHIPYRKSSTFDIHSKKCSLCKIGDVPDILLITIELPDSLQITGRGCFVQAQVCRTKKDLKSESNAKEISDAIPFLEYEIHRLLVNKIKSKGMNALFGLKATIAIGERVIALIATGTAVFLPSLPAPSPPRIVAGNSWSNSDKISDLQKSIQETFDRNREIYQLKSSEELELESKNATSDDMYLKDIEPNEIDLTNGNEDACVLEVDDIEDLEIFALLMEPSPPDGFHVVNTQTVPGLHDLEVIRNLQMFVQVYRAKLGLNQQASNFPKHFQRLVHTIYFKIRSMIPCAICDFRFRLDFPESEEIQILVTGMALGLGEPSKLTKYKRKVAAHPQTKESKRLADDELIFNLEEEELTEQPLCHIAGGKIDKYLGNLNFFFIRESTSVKENGGISGFVHSFITEVLAIVRANVTALGGNAMVSFYMTDMILVDNPHKNQGQCLISVGGDVVFVSYFSDD